MAASQLVQIIRRLDAMRNDHTGNRQRRTFEQFGIPVCEVTYIRDRVRFDDLDLAAIEVFNCLYDFRNTF